MCVCTCVHGTCKCTCVHGTCVCTCVHIHVYMCVYMYVYMFVHGKNGKKRVTIKKHDEIALKMVQIDSKID